MTTDPEFWTDAVRDLYQQYSRGIRTPETLEANRIHQRLYRLGLFPPRPPGQHNRSRYSRGCRCEICTHAATLYHRNRRAKAKETKK